jgi:hypothetical protein
MAVVTPPDLSRRKGAVWARECFALVKLEVLPQAVRCRTHLVAVWARARTRVVVNLHVGVILILGRTGHAAPIAAEDLFLVGELIWFDSRGLGERPIIPSRKDNCACTLEIG